MRNMAINTQALPVMERLKLATRANHDLIEKTPCMNRLFAKDYSLEEYRGLLEKMYGFVSAYEPALFEHLDAGLAEAFAHRRKCGWLERDLLNFDLAPAQIAALPRCARVPHITGLPQCLGIWYVLEGATLGGELMARHLSQQFGAAAEKVTAFHRAYGDGTQAEWRAFRELMDARFPPERAADIEAAAQSAQLTFEYLCDWLRKV